MTYDMTPDRVKALGNINRYNGWTSRPYSVLEHTVLGAAALSRMGQSVNVVRAFLLHDMHETEFGDEIRPVQEAHPNPSLTRAKHEFDLCLYDAMGVSTAFIGSTGILNIDNLMLSIELNHPTLVTRTTDRDFPEYEHEQKTQIIAGIDDNVFRGVRAVEAWYALWD